MDISIEEKEEIERIVGVENTFYNVSMRGLTTFKIGGQADIVVTPKTPSGIQAIVMYAKKKSIPYFVLGNGSNILVSDKGIDGIVIRIAENFSNIAVKENTIVASSGALLSKVANMAYKNSLTGLEFASGIPGTIGGAMRMNAGAYGSEMKDVVKKVTVLDKNGAIFELSNSDMNFGYRNSVVKEAELVVLQVEMLLEKGESTAIKDTMEELKQKRCEKQPINFPSAGSTFKRPKDNFAGKLIEDSGLKGCMVGDAQVSEKHCGFIINRGEATCEDVCNLIDKIKKSVKKKQGVELEREVIFVGRL